MNAVEEVVAVHNGTHSGLLDCFAECREVDLLKCAHVNVAAGVVTVPLLVVGGKMLDSRYDAARLQGVDVAYSHL